MLSSDINIAINMLQNLYVASQQPEAAEITAQRLLGVMQKELKLETGKMITDYDALRNIQNSFEQIIEKDRAGRIATKFKIHRPGDAT